MSDNNNYDEQDDTCAMCTDCLTVIPDRYAFNDKFLQAGLTGVCPFCKGPVVVTTIDESKKLRDRRRGGQPL